MLSQCMEGGVSAFHFNVSPSEYVPPRCKIDWNKGKNVTVKTVKKKQKHKGQRSGVRGQGVICFLLVELACPYT